MTLKESQNEYNKKCPSIAFRTDKDTFKRLKDYMNKNGLTLKEVMNESLIQYLDNAEKPFYKKLLRK